MELTGRMKVAKFETAKEGLEKQAAAQKEKAEEQAPRLFPPARRGAVAGGVVGAGGAALAARKENLRRISEGMHSARPTTAVVPAAKRISLRRAALGGSAVGAGIGGAIGLGYGVKKLKEHLQKQASGLTPVQKRLLGGAAGALGAGALGGAHHYLKARPGRGGKSIHELEQEMELERLKRLFKNQDPDLKKLPAMKKMKQRYREMMLEHTQKAKQTPGRAALKGAIPYALGGGVVGAGFAPRLIS